MSNIVLKDQQGNDIIYNNVSSVELLNDQGSTTTFVLPATVDVSRSDNAVRIHITDADESKVVELKDGYTPVKSVDYWTPEDQEAIKEDAHAYIMDELAKRGQQKPEFANSIEECIDTTKLYVLPDGYIYAYILTNNQTINQLAVATDTNNSVYNGIGYKNDARLNSSGVEDTSSSAANMSLTGFIPIKADETVYLQGVNFNKNSSKLSSHRIAFYDTSKTFITGSITQGTNVNNLAAVWNDEGDLIQFTANGYYGGNAASYGYFRICGDAFDLNPIITVNEPISSGSSYNWTNTGHAFVPADYEDRIVALEQHLETTDSDIADHEERLASIENADNTGIPEYVQTAAKAVARTVNSRQNETSTVFAFLADGHCGWSADATHEAVKQAAQAVGVINNRCPLDFVAHGGDLSVGGSYSTIDSTFTDIEDYTEIMSEVSATVPSLWMAGNHDDAPYQATANRLTQAQTFALIGRKNLRSGAMFNGGCSYGYFDMNSRKVRVIYLDTHDKREWGTVDCTNGTSSDFMNANNIGGVQLNWLATTALNFAGKESPEEWAVVVCSHAALNSSGTVTDTVSGESFAYSTTNAAAILAAYRDSNSGSITHNGVTVNYDFTSVSGKAMICCAVHGHNHMYSSETVSGILSIGCPNVMNGRERESADGNTYTKTAGTAQGTSFCIITVDRKNRKIYADHYGAGYDRVFNY